MNARSGRLASAVVYLVAVVPRPQLWLVAIRQARRLAPRRWWSTRPYMPMPSSAYLRFRSLTQYGDENHRVEVADVVDYLLWCKDMRRVANQR